MNVAHTPEPWKVDEIADGSSSGKDDGQSLPIIVGKGGTIAVVKACSNPRLAFGDASLPDLGDVRGCEGWALGRRIAFANARLIVTAPEMLKALKRLSFAAFCRESTQGDPCRLLEVQAELRAADAAARVIIAKAEGRA